MPDITMCKGGEEGCPLASTCFRSPDSGTVPMPTYQAWFVDAPFWREWRSDKVTISCDEYWEVRKKGTENGVQRSEDPAPDSSGE